MCTHFDSTGQTDWVWSLPLRRVSDQPGENVSLGSRCTLLIGWGWDVQKKNGEMRTSHSGLQCILGDYTPHRELGFKKAHCELVMLCLVRNQQETNTGWSLCFICSCRGSNELLFSSCNERQSTTKTFKAFPPNMHEMNISCFTRRAGGERRGFM